MARKRKGTPIHGWIVLDKPLGMSSAQAVAAVRRITGAAKAGHGGTLDPAASGVLPIALGEATKTVSYVMDGAKLYRFTLRWGEARDSDDAEGRVTQTSPVRPSQAAIEAVLPRFTGTIMQTPPAYSAIKVAGERAYDLARGGEPPILAARPITIESLRLIAQTGEDHAEFEAETGKGAYIRALARDLGTELGTVAHITALRRLKVGRFHIAAAISLDNLALLGHSAPASEHLLPIETALDDIPALALTEAEAVAMRHGQSVMPVRPSDRACIDRLQEGSTICATEGGKLVALAELVAGTLRPVRVMNFE